MKYIDIGGVMRASAIGLGCMRMSGLSDGQADALLGAALDSGINFFDHADIYGGGKSEEVFAAALSRSGARRDTLFIQAKCGICRGYFDYSRQHIIEAVEGSLRRMKLDYVDALLLHRPDALVEPEQVAEAFDELALSGKVRFFGVSNHSAAQMQLLSGAVRQKLIINQLQFGIAHTPMLDEGLNVNMLHQASQVRAGGLIEYMRMQGITMQAWSPMMYGMFEGVFLGSEKYAQLNAKLAEFGRAMEAAPAAVSVAWILRHPAHIQVLAGTTSPEHLADFVRATELTLTRPAWYELYRAAGNQLP